MIFRLPELSRLFCKPFLIGLPTFSFLIMACSTLSADVLFVGGAPWGFDPEEVGHYAFDNLTGGTVSVLATDTDESSKEILSTSEQQFAVTITGGSGKLTAHPHYLNAGDWAHAIAVYQNNLPLFFFQIRGVGSTAEVMDSSLASAAVAANLWTSTDDYFEFYSGHAIVFPIVEQPTGPASFGSSSFPEPTTVALLCIATCCFPSRFTRHIT